MTFKSSLIIKTAFILTALFPSASLLTAQSYKSNQSHDGKVSAVASTETYDGFGDSFFSGGKDGFLVKWDGQTGEHYQVGDFEIKMIAKNPNNNEVAVYETNGVNVHRVSIWDWNTFTRKKSKRFQNAVTSLNYSEKGKYIIIGTAAVNQLYVMDGNLSQIVKKLNVGVTTAARTGASENSIMIYSSNGAITYFNTKTWAMLGRVSCEPNLTNTVIFGAGEYKNAFLAGIKENILYIIEANTGKLIAQYQVNASAIMSARSKNEEGLYFISSDSKKYSLNLIKQSDLYTHLEYGMNPQVPPNPVLIKNFMGLQNGESITCFAKDSSDVILGTNEGNIYRISSASEAEMLTAFPVTENLYDRIIDHAAYGNDFLFLTPSSIYKSSYEENISDRVGINPGQTNITCCRSQAILWSRGTKKPVQLVNLSSGSTDSAVTLFTPEYPVSKLNVYGNLLVYILGNSQAGIYNLSDRTNKIAYEGTSLQDAIIYNDETIYVAKSRTQEGDSAIVCVNLTTGETSPVRIGGTVAYSLSYNPSVENSPLYGVVIEVSKDQPNTTITKIFSMNLSTKIVTVLFSIKTEDSSAWTILNEPFIYTNLGQSAIRSVNLENQSIVAFNRSASLPLKVQANGEKAAVLNKNGSISWYEPGNPTLLSDWYLTTEGKWIEF